jgi:hypothetical protein
MFDIGLGLHGLIFLNSSGLDIRFRRFEFEDSSFLERVSIFGSAGLILDRIA